MRTYALSGLAIALAAMLAGAPASAQLYKWVDARGVTNYSNQPPDDPNAAKNLRPVEDRVSVYSPDAALLQAVEDTQQNSRQRQNQRARIESLESQLEAERRARQQAAAPDARASAYDKCLADGRVDCTAVYGSYQPYDPPVVFVRNRHRRQHIPQTVLPPGAIAGNVTAGNGVIAGHVNSRNGTIAGTATGTNGIMPGNSAAAPGKNAPSQRPLLERR